MTTFPRTPLDEWIAQKIGLPETAPLSMEALARHQLVKLNATIAFAYHNSLFYREHFGGQMPVFLERTADLCRLPFTTAEDLCRDPFSFLCVPQDAISRIVTLNSAGTTQTPKSVFFTDADLELSIDFFHRGLSALVSPGQRVLILMPGEHFGSVGDLLKKGLARMDVRGLVQSPMSRPEEIVDTIRHNRIDCLVGLPARLNRLAWSHAAVDIPVDQIKSVLLTADFVPQAIATTLEKVWHCKVYQHYGMTESGLGGGVECARRNGYHLREADLFYEIVDPNDGSPLPVGAIGEVVFTTLTRRGMPLIRYRTGDMAAFAPLPCPCGSILRRMQPVQGRIGGGITLKGFTSINLQTLDEAIFAVDGVMDYEAIIEKRPAGQHLDIRVIACSPRPPGITSAVRTAVLSIPGIGKAVAAGKLHLNDIEPLAATDNGVIIHRIIDHRKEADL